MRYSYEEIQRATRYMPRDFEPLRLPNKTLEKLRPFFEDAHGWHGARAIVDSDYKPHVESVTVVCACGERVEFDVMDLVRRGLK
jgi:hypothetical protein